MRVTEIEPPPDGSGAPEEPHGAGTGGALEPPAGGFGAPILGQPTAIVHRKNEPKRPSNGLHVVFGTFGALVAAMCLLVLWGQWKKQRYIRGIEARGALIAIAGGVETSYARTGELCPSARAVPADFEAVRGKSYPSKPDEWAADPGWSCAGFAMTLPQHYQYRLETDGEFVTVLAAGDLDGDDLRSTLEMRGHVEADHRRVVFDPTIRERNPGE